MKLQKENFLPRIAINRPVTIVMSLIAFLVVGYIAFTQIAVELFPSGFTPPFLGVWTPYNNSNPQEVEEQIAKPIEEQVRTISGVRRVHTSSSSNGCWAFIEFAQGMDMNLAYAQLRDRMDRVKAELPEDIERQYLRKWSDDDDPVLWISLIQNKTYEDPYLLVEQHIQKPLERVDGVAKVEIWGADEKIIMIDVDQRKVKSYRINLYEIIQQLRNDNFSISSGFVKEGGRKIFVRSVAKFVSIDELRELPIKGANIRLKDIAEVKYDVPEYRWRMISDGKKAINLGIFKESEANTVELCENVKRILMGDIANDPKVDGFQANILFNQGELISDSIDNLLRTAMWGGVFAFIVLFFFLRRFRMTFIVSFALPLSILFSLTVIYFIGWSLNVITMMGLMISIGMVVDNSIVVLENIYRKRAEGNSDRKAALLGTSEVILAITMATFTTIVVFLPLILMNDEIGFQFYMLRIGLPVIISLLASLMIALILIPLAATRVVSHSMVKEPAIILRWNRIYQKMLSWVIGHRLETFILLIFVTVSMFFAASRAINKPGMDGNINDFVLVMEMPDNYTLDDAEHLMGVVEDTVLAKRDVYNIKTLNSRFRNNWGRMRVFLNQPPRVEWYTYLYKNIMKAIGFKVDDIMARKDVIEDIKSRLPLFPGVKMRTTWHDEGQGDGASMAIVLYGDDTNTLIELSREVERRLKSIEEIISIETDRERGGDEIRLNINREQAKKYGISPSLISGTVQYALRGFPVPKYHTEQKEVEVRIQLREEDRKNLLQLKNMTFYTQEGKEIPLDAIASFTVQKSIGEIQREDGKTYLRVKANTTKDNISVLYNKVDAVMKGFAMPYGYSWSKGQRFRRMQESNSSQQFALILSFTFVFLLMGILFESFVLPLSVIMAVPLSFVGAYWIMYLTKTPIDLMSQIGFVILIGIVVNNSIVLIDLINRLRNEGLSRFEAIMDAGRHRFRPILMTAFTTIGGLLPMAVGNARMIGIPYAPMGRTIIGGLLTSTFLSLLAVPWAYTLFDDMRAYFKKIAVSIKKREQQEGLELKL